MLQMQTLITQKQIDAPGDKRAWWKFCDKVLKNGFQRTVSRHKALCKILSKKMKGKREMFTYYPCEFYNYCPSIRVLVFLI